MLRLKDLTGQNIGPETLARQVREAMIVRVARALMMFAHTRRRIYFSRTP